MATGRSSTRCASTSPRPAYERECEFWRDLTGLELQDSTYFEEFRTLARPADQPIRLLLQRVGDDRPRVTAHLDIYTNDREAETRRHEALGAKVLRRHPHFTVLTDPAGSGVLHHPPRCGNRDARPTNGWLTCRA